MSSAKSCLDHRAGGRKHEVGRNSRDNYQVQLPRINAGRFQCARSGYRRHFRRGFLFARNMALPNPGHRSYPLVARINLRHEFRVIHGPGGKIAAHSRNAAVEWGHCKLPNLRRS